MQDVIGKFFIIIIGAIILFFVPVTIIALKQDNTAQTYIDNAVTEFVDNARATARITPQSYRKLIEKVDAANPGCNIQIIHSARYIAPAASDKELEIAPPESGEVPISEKKYKYAAFMEDYFKDEIVNYMFPSDTSKKERDYILKSGDYLKVIVDNNDNPTLGGTLASIISTNYSTNTLYTSYGGYIGNYAQ